MSKYVISISSGVYTRGMGGTNKVVLSHQKMFNKYGIKYVYLCPVENGVTNKLRIATKGYWNLIVDGEYQGVVNELRFQDFRNKQFQDGNEEVAVFLHHFKGVDYDSLKQILKQNNSNIYIYIHDYYLICENYNLLDDEGNYCGDEGLKTKCVRCPHYKRSLTIQFLFRELMNSISNNIRFVAPSDAAKLIWTKTYPEFSEEVLVIYHQKLFGEYECNFSKLNKESSVKIAFVGAALRSKGWEDFVDVVKSSPKELGYKYYHFGMGGENNPNITTVPVVFHDGLNTMIEVLRSNEIDLAVLWSLWPETYSYTYYEAFASNAFIITNVNSGNMCDQVVKNNNGVVLADKKEFIQFLNNKSKLVSLVNAYRESGIKGPKLLQENEDIVDIVLKSNTEPSRCNDSRRLSLKVRVKCGLFAMSEMVVSKIKELIHESH